MIKKYGEKKVNWLYILSQQIFRDDLTLIELWIDQELNKYLSQYPVLNYSCLNLFIRIKNEQESSIPILP